jgi:hypothetical protein
MARDDTYEEEAPADNMAGLANAMIILTGLMLVGAIVMINMLSSKFYGQSLF